MKTAIKLSGNFFNFNKLKIKPLCVLKSLFSGSVLYLPLQSLQSESRMLHPILHAILGCLAGAGSKVRVGYNEIVSNNRVIVGVWMLAGAAFMYWAHLFFINPDLVQHGIVSPVAFINDPIQDGFFFKRWFYWFFTNREEFLIGLFLSGGFLLCKTDIKWGWKYAVVPVITICFSEVLYQTVFISHWTHFYRSIFTVERSWELVLFLSSLLFASYKILDYLCYRKYHTKDGNIARFFGIVKAPNIAAETKLMILDGLVDESENFNAR